MRISDESVDGLVQTRHDDMCKRFFFSFHFTINLYKSGQDIKIKTFGSKSLLAISLIACYMYVYTKLKFLNQKSNIKLIYSSCRFVFVVLVLGTGTLLR